MLPASKKIISTTYLHYFVKIISTTLWRGLINALQVFINACVKLSAPIVSNCNFWPFRFLLMAWHASAIIYTKKLLLPSIVCHFVENEVRKRSLEKKKQNVTWVSDDWKLKFCKWRSFWMTIQLIFCYTFFKTKIKNS